MTSSVELGKGEDPFQERLLMTTEYFIVLSSTFDQSNYQGKRRRLYKIKKITNERSGGRNEAESQVKNKKIQPQNSTNTGSGW